MAGSRRSRRTSSGEALAAALALSFAPPAIAAPAVTIVGDGAPQPLTATPGDVARGRAIVGDRQLGLCLLCHTGPFPENRFQGGLAPDLAGAGSRESEAQLRLRIIDARRLNPDTIMPPFFSVDGLVGVAPAFAGKTLLDAQQVEDVVAFLSSLREGKHEP